MPPKQGTVSIQCDYCPLCYRGGVISEKIPSNSARIDNEQRECSRLYRGLPLIDLERMGPKCNDACKLVCIVCGSAMAFACEPCFEEAQDVVEKYEEDETETRIEVVEQMQCLSNLGASMLQNLERRFYKTLRKMGMAWHPRWKRLVHAHCIRKAECHCLLARGVNTCITHKKSLIQQKGMMASKPEKKLMKPVVIPAKPAIKCTSNITVVTGSWLKPLSKTVKLPVSQDTPIPAAQTLRQKSTLRKTNPRLEQAAQKCRKLDSWVGAKNNTIREQTGNASFDLERHYKLFDPMVHGYVTINGVDMYRFPHGPVVQVFSAVNTLTQDGNLIPS